MPYAGFACLCFPSGFWAVKMFESALQMIDQEAVKDYIEIEDHTGFERFVEKEIVSSR